MEKQESSEFNREQAARAEAVKLASNTLRESKGLACGEPGSVIDIVELSNYIITGQKAFGE